MEYSQMLKAAWNSDKRHILVTGDTGSGKTYFLQNIACTLTESVPIYIDLARANGNSFILKEILREYCGHTEFNDTESILTAKLLELLNTRANECAKYVILLDGIDEIPPCTPSNLNTELEQLCNLAGAQLVIAVSNKSFIKDNYSFGGLKDFSVYSIQPLPDLSVQKLLEEKSIYYACLNNVIKSELRKPQFLNIFLKLSDAGEDISNCTSIHALYSAIVTHDVDVLGNRDGKYGTAEYALTKLLPALACKLDCVYFDYESLKQAFLQAFVETSYANRGLDNVSSHMLARFKSALSTNDSQLLTNIKIIESLNQYNGFFLDRHYIVQVDENNYRFSHYSWLQYFQIQHIINEIYKTDAKTIPDSIPSQQIERYFEVNALSQKAVHEDPVTLAAAAFQENVIGQHKKKTPRWLKTVCAVSVAAVFVCLVLLAIHFWPRTPMYNFTLTPSEMTLSQFDEATSTIKSRVDLMAGGKKHTFTVDNNTIEFSLPQSSLGSMRPLFAVQTYISREQNYYILNSDSIDNMTSKYDYVPVRQRDIERVSADSGIIPDFDLSDHEEINTDGYNYLEICMNSSWSEAYRNTVKEWANPWFAANITYDSWSYNDSVFVREAGDNIIIYIAFEDEITENLINTLVFNLTHPPLAHAFYVDVAQEILWENPQKAIKPGALQCKDSVFKNKNSITIYYDTTITDLDTGSWLDLLIGMRKRMDAIGEPYAIGYKLKDTTSTYQLLIKTLPNHLNTPVIQILTTNYLGSAFSVISGTRRYSGIHSSYNENNVVRKKVTESGQIMFGIKTESTPESKTLPEFVAECAEAGEQELRFCINYIPVFCTTIDNISESGEILFDTIFWNGEQITKDTEWLIDFVLTIFNGERLPCEISYYGAITDASKDIKIEDYFEVDNKSRLEHYSDIIKSISNRTIKNGVAKGDETSYLIFLELPINEDLPIVAIKEIEDIYNIFDFEHSEFRSLSFYIGDEDSLLGEQARIIFVKALSDESIDVHVALSGGRYEKYAAQFNELLDDSAFFKQFDISRW